ncbi:DUF3488 and DUF4129 domain-containing transglutaminase family protein [Aestuariirhabdus sp. Z084]|uniref:transglutaminase TgpA family protein n=1 Tax=Aestuariirhabdus haliotis TaxID=2918751 RepID=UPI00201B3A42|nr:DUF3488 and DUF4129 domain-containing transglutaminase family protein [Aestuariirhabdus haliotis]MCL6414553.1 DUF3488 and DUF4129 domain-containing transglutaminase family protein [Aestuariirhabdus haliotis]MCL6418465.1 DUF3488 and DUF4129 domain-containing transglutaminase family protein [Aestuariirhabdus haliotis]
MSTLNPNQIPRTALFWLLACQLLAVLPHFGRLPIWVLLLAIVCTSWRLMIFTGRWSYPPFWLKSMLLLSAVAAIQWRYHSLVGLDAGGCLLVAAFILKLLEMKSPRDAYLVIFLSCFVVVIALLYDQSLVSSSFAMLNFLVIVAAAVGLNQGGLRERPLAAARKATVMLLQAIPLAIILFVLVPRVPPLWSVEPPGSQARTGLSNSMAPGDIAQLTQSDELVFRATFEGAVPEQRNLYWRALNLSYFDGRRWSERPVNQGQIEYRLKAPPSAARDRVALGSAVDYRVILEPTDQRWLFALDMVSSSVQGATLTRDSRLLTPDTVERRFSYAVQSALDYRLDSELDSWIREFYLQLPDAGDPRTREFARDLYRSVNEDGLQFVQSLMTRFREQEYFYTLRPPVLRDDTIDGFLFESRRGFCAHYAGAFVFLARAAGIPARVVVGYQGGEVNPELSVVQVRQFDAHAWAEVWLPEQGWLRVDPTAAVAPDRIEQNLQQAVAEEGSFLENELFSAHRYQGIPLLSRLRLQLDMLEYYWHQNVLDFDQQRQQGFWQDWLGGVDIGRVVIALLVAAAITLGALGGWGWWSQRLPARDPIVSAYLLFCRRLERYGLTREQGEGPLDFLKRIQDQQPDIAKNAEHLTRLYVNAQYVSSAQHKAGWKKQRVKAMKRIIRRL